MGTDPPKPPDRPTPPPQPPARISVNFADWRKSFDAQNPRVERREPVPTGGKLDRAGATDAVKPQWREADKHKEHVETRRVDVDRYRSRDGSVDLKALGGALARYADHAMFSKDRAKPPAHDTARLVVILDHVKTGRDQPGKPSEAEQIQKTLTGLCKERGMFGLVLVRDHGWLTTASGVRMFRDPTSSRLPQVPAPRPVPPPVPPPMPRPVPPTVPHPPHVQPR